MAAVIDIRRKGESYRRVDAALLRRRTEMSSVFATFMNGTETLDEDSNLWVFVRLWDQVVRESKVLLGAIPDGYFWPMEHRMQRETWAKAAKERVPDPTWRVSEVTDWVKEVVLPMYTELQAAQQATLLVNGQEAAFLVPPGSI